MSTYLLGGQDFFYPSSWGPAFFTPSYELFPINCSKMPFLYILGFLDQYSGGGQAFFIVSRASRWLYIRYGFATFGSIAVFLMNQYFAQFFYTSLDFTQGFRKYQICKIFRPPPDVSVICCLLSSGRVQNFCPPLLT